MVLGMRNFLRDLEGSSVLVSAGICSIMSMWAATMLLWPTWTRYVLAGAGGILFVTDMVIAIPRSRREGAAERAKEAEATYLKAESQW